MFPWGRENSLGRQVSCDLITKYQTFQKSWFEFFHKLSQRWSFSCGRLFVTPWSAACQAPLPMGVSKQEYWSGLPCSPPGYFVWPKDRTHISCVSCFAGRFFTAESGGTLISSTYMLSCSSSVTLFVTPMDCSLPGSSVHGILQPRILEWVALPFSRGSSLPRDWTCVSYVSCTGKLVLYY